MRGTGSTFSRLSAARAFIAGAAILAGATAPRAFAQPRFGSEDTAMAIPRVAPPGGAGVALPQPLPPSEAARVRRVFELQARGKIAEAAQEMALLDMSTPAGHGMIGHILADRHLGRFTHTTADELQSWLTQWSDLPDAPQISTLLTRRTNNGGRPQAPAPTLASLSDSQPAAPVPEETESVDQRLPRNGSLDRSVWAAARSGSRGAVARLLARTSGLTAPYAAELRGEAARILFTLNRDEEAYGIAAEAFRPDARGNTRHLAAALVGYTGGLAAWRLGRPEQARELFEAGWNAGYGTSAQRAATAFWAARANLRCGNPADYVPWMTRAAEERRTFYGLLARRTLGLGFGFAPGGRADGETLGEADIEAVAATPQGLRAFALLQVGQTARAEAELRLLWPEAQSTPSLGRAIMLVAAQSGLIDLAAQLADLIQAADGRPRDATRFPVPKLRPANGFVVDPPLVYGITRTESDFDADLVSPMGATGLMQIMPETASLVSGGRDSGSLRGMLRDPAFNLDLGQRYIAYLAEQDSIDRNLIRLLASYNAGPGNLEKWLTTIRDDGDPLLFIEAIPLDETRAYVPRVLTYSWIYAARLAMRAASLDELAAGAWPRYHAREVPTQVLARLH